MVIYEVAANEYEKMSDLAHGLKKMAGKLAKCLENLEEQEGDDDYNEEEYDDYDSDDYDQPQLRRRVTRYREVQDPNNQMVVDDPEGNQVMKTRRGRNARGQYTSMRNRGKRMPRSRYDIEVY